MNYWIDTNLTFEYELAERPFENIARFTQPWNFLLRLLKNFEEANLLCPQSKLRDGDKVAIWGVLDRHRGRCIPNLPDSQSVYNANSKIWCFENRPKVLPHETLISQNTTKIDLLAAISSTSKWIVKDPFGVAGRERFNGDSTTDIDALRNWMKKSGRGDLLFEPYIDIEFEFSVHYEIDQSKQVRYLGSSALICDKNGIFRGNYALPPRFDNELSAVKAAHIPVLEKLTKIGYWGPLSIDGFVGTHMGTEVSQPLSEINARYTFGRMFLEIQRILGRTDFLWWHPSPKVFKSISKSPLETPTLVFPLHYMNTKTFLLCPIEKALEEIKIRT